MDSAEFSSLVSDLDGAQAFRAETIDFIQRCLTGDENILDSELPSSLVIASFKPIGEAISKSCTTSEQTNVIKS